MYDGVEAELGEPRKTRKAARTGATATASTIKLQISFRILEDAFSSGLEIDVIFKVPFLPAWQLLAPISPFLEPFSTVKLNLQLDLWPVVLYRRAKDVSVDCCH